jgi:hypothetical protein
MSRGDVSLFVATLALVFTVGSSWWLHARRGRLRAIGEPRSFALSTSGGLLLNLPLVLSNSGPTPVVGINLRLRFEKPGLPETVPFTATRPGVQPKGDDLRPLATAVVLKGHEAMLICCEFTRRPFPVELAEGELSVTVEALEKRSWGKPRWRTLVTFPLRISKNVVDKQASYIAHDNSSEVT